MITNCTAETTLANYLYFRKNISRMECIFQKYNKTIGTVLKLQRNLATCNTIVIVLLASPSSSLFYCLLILNILTLTDQVAGEPGVSLLSYHARRAFKPKLFLFFCFLFTCLHSNIKLIQQKRIKHDRSNHYSLDELSLMQCT